MKQLIPVLLLLVTFTVQSQISGELITVSGENISGEVRYQGDIQMRDAVDFKATGASNYRTYSPEEIKSFIFGDVYYYEAIALDGKKAFLPCLVKGNYSLYKNINKQNKLEYYVSTNDSTFFLLKSTKEFVNVNGITKKKENYEYIATLKILMQDIPAILNQINDLKFDDNSLQNIVYQYNEMTQPDNNAKFFRFENHGIAWHFGPDIGAAVFAFEHYGIRTGFLLEVEPKDITNRVSGSFGFYYINYLQSFLSVNDAALIMQLYGSYAIIKKSAFNLSIDFGITSELLLEQWFFSGFLLGAHSDIEVCKNQLRITGGFYQIHPCISVAYLF